MKKSSAILGSILLVAANVYAAGPTYVGGGRYTCYEKTTGCAIVNENNRRITKEEIEANRPEPYHNPDPTFSGPTGYSDAPIGHTHTDRRDGNKGRK